MVENIPIVEFTFNQSLSSRDLKKFRGAVIESVLLNKKVFEAAGIETHWFHNHVEGSNDRYYHYPLIQYRLNYSKVAILGIGKGAVALKLWMALVGKDFQVNNVPFSLEVRHLREQEWQPILSKEKSFRINSWAPFNPKNFKLWKENPQLVDRAQLLDKVIWGHFFHLFETLDIEVDKEDFVLYLSSIESKMKANGYNSVNLTLDVMICTNLNLPSLLAVGRHVSLGFGKIEHFEKKR